VIYITDINPLARLSLRAAGDTHVLLISHAPLQTDSAIDRLRDSLADRSTADGRHNVHPA
jgi:hypothetical protein